MDFWKIRMHKTHNALFLHYALEDFCFIAFTIMYLSKLNPYNIMSEVSLGRGFIKLNIVNKSDNKIEHCIKI